MEDLDFSLNLDLASAIRSTLAPGMLAGVLLLLRGYRCSQRTGSDPWEFAVEVEDVRAAGMSNSDIRWLLAEGYVRKAREITHRLDLKRIFVPNNTYVICERSCLILTPTGFGALSGVAGAAQGPADGRGRGDRPPADTRADAGDRATAARGPKAPVDGVPHAGSARPSWDAVKRELRVGESLVKKYKVPAPTQQLILDVFHEEGWPEHIDDPLPSSAAIDPKRRLHNAINSLNRNQRDRLIHFHGNGNGDGIYWRLADRRSGVDGGGASSPDRRWSSTDL
jgi:hypothetical protein